MHTLVLRKWIILLICLLIASACLAENQSQSQNSPLATESFPDLYRVFLVNSTEVWQAKINALNENYEDAQGFEALEEAIDLQQKARLDSLFEANGTTAKGFYRFGTTHIARIAKHLEENPQAGKEIWDLEATIDKQVEEFDSLLTVHDIRKEEK